MNSSSSLPELTIGNKSTFPIIQWWMGVWISNWRLAWTVAKEWAVWTLSSVGHSVTPAYKPLFNALIKEKKAYFGWKIPEHEFERIFYDANIAAIYEEVKKAKEVAQGNWALWINVMVAVNDYTRQVLAACDAWVDGIVSGAGLPLNLPEITKEYPNVSLIPILSNLKGVRILLKKWERLGRIPNAIILEDPSRAGGHLWSASVNNVDNSDTTLEVAVPEVIEFLNKEWLHVPVIAAGWIVSRDDMNRVLNLGASWVQMGTRFLATHESWASDDFKNAILHANEKDITIYTSNALLPARAIATSGIFHMIEWRVAETRKCIENCLIHCWYRDWIGELKGSGDTPAQMCILHALARGTEWNRPHAKSEALYFTGVSALKISTLKSVKEIIEELTY